MSALPDRIVMASVGDHLIVQMPQPGPCGGCMSCAVFFVCRGGHVLCVHCDAREQERQKTEARVTLEMAFSGPVVIPCRCPVDRHPDALFKCTCEASYPENAPCCPGGEPLPHPVACRFTDDPEGTA
ncbi:MAG: hypothetical protein Q8L48_16620 [Archangium sp.]|nr:hypothetical protein [Archangium sp.]